MLDEGVTPTTSQIHILRYGPAPATEVSAAGIRLVTAAVDFLRDIHIVDTPGTNAIIREHERLTTEFMPRADLVLFVTSAERPFTEYFQRFWFDVTVYTTRMLAAGLAVADPSKLLFGTDAPFNGDGTEDVRRVVEMSPDLTDEQRAGILGTNALAFLGGPIAATPGSSAQASAASTLCQRETSPCRRRK